MLAEDFRGNVMRSMMMISYVYGELNCCIMDLHSHKTTDVRFLAMIPFKAVWQEQIFFLARLNTF